MLVLFGRSDWGLFAEVVGGIAGAVVVGVRFVVSVAVITVCLMVEGA